MGIDTEVQLLRNRRTKIVATLGPASREPATIAALVEAGVNMFRLNMSHGDHASHGETFSAIRAASDKAGRAIAVLADLAGPKIRVGRFRDGAITLEEGATVVVTTRDIVGEPGLVPSQYAGLSTDVRDGDRILLADGVMELRVDEVSGTEISCTVVQGGLLSDRKGINLPEVAVSAPCLTEKDRADAKFMIGLGVDFLGLSFVRRGEDVLELKSLIEAWGGTAGIIAKIQRPEALTNSESIIDAADGIMVARGDLGVELPPEQVPIAQHELIDHGRRKNKPVIVATQMLESMIENPRPTRAEVADVSQAVFGGADAVMLSGETASGAHPVAAVRMMNRIARHTEGYLWERGAFG
ncbi:MAG: pyruvate kinase, partial [Gammaproteobacteria bacterium]|nr:pyruvate kinase [Gammaproteobacteria bacterium]